jgi:hypothetical protein
MGRPSSTKKVLGFVFAAAIAPAMFAATQAQENDGEGLVPPDFAGTWTRKGDVTATGEYDGTSPSTFQAPPSGPTTILTATPHWGHCDYLPPGLQNSDPCPPGVTQSRESNPWIADIDNPILLPWTREVLRANRDGEAAGESHMSFQQHCKPSGVPQVINLRYQLQLVQAPDQVTMLYENNQQVRRVYMNQKHPDNPPRTWYGHSVGHYEGDTLVIDTIAQVDSTEVDRFGTPHTDKLHVVERYRIDVGGFLEVIFMVEDEGAFTMPWRGMAQYRPTYQDFPEYICAENNRATMDSQAFDIPNDTTPDF